MPLYNLKTPTNLMFAPNVIEVSCVLPDFSSRSLLEDRWFTGVFQAEVIGVRVLLLCSVWTGGAACMLCG